LRELEHVMISFGTGNSLLSYLTAQSSQNSGSTDTTASASAATNARVAATAKAALAAAGSTHQASVAERALDKQQTALAANLRAAMAQAGVKLSGPVEFSVVSDGTLAVKGTEADARAATEFLKADASKPGFSAQLTALARDAGKLSATIQQSAAISQAARYGGRSGGVMSLYASLMQQSNTAPAVFTVSASTSSLTYPGVLAAKA
jgi:hypothetical protein